MQIILFPRSLGTYAVHKRLENIFESCHEILLHDSLLNDQFILEVLTHYENTNFFKYIETFTTKNWKFSDKNSDIFHISAQNIDCGYSLEPPRRGGSNEYHNLCFWGEIRK